MKTTLDPQVLTDFALDELDASARVAVESALNANDALRAEVQRIRDAAGVLGAAYADEGSRVAPPPALSVRAVVESRLARRPTGSPAAPTVRGLLKALFHARPGKRGALMAASAAAVALAMVGLVAPQARNASISYGSSPFNILYHLADAERDSVVSRWFISGGDFNNDGKYDGAESVSANRPPTTIHGRPVQEYSGFSSTFFNETTNGDIRARTENIFNAAAAGWSASQRSGAHGMSGRSRPSAPANVNSASSDALGKIAQGAFVPDPTLPSAAQANADSGTAGGELTPEQAEAWWRRNRELDESRPEIQMLRSPASDIDAKLSTGISKKVQARVTAIDEEAGVVLLSAGMADNVRIGSTFVVYRDDRYKVMVQVTEVSPNQCAGLILWGTSIRKVEPGDEALEVLDDGPAVAPPAARPVQQERYAPVAHAPFSKVGENPLSTFSIDVDTASYANVRRMLMVENRLPPAGAVRVEEMLNSFTYAYEPPRFDRGDPFAAHVEVGACPWNRAHLLARIGLKGKEIPEEARPTANLVFLVDVSGSMQEPNKLPLVVRCMTSLISRLRAEDRVTVVVYAGNEGLALDTTACDAAGKTAATAALERLSAGGSTNGGAGITLAYAKAKESFIRGGSNRVILCTDGDFNVGVTSDAELVRLVREQAKSGVFLTALGFGMGNFNDAMLEQIADQGNGNYGYVDSADEGERLLGRQLAGTLFTIAKDVKIQVEFNPAAVAAYRLIGYENRALAARDFNDDTKDAGEIGVGHTVTALYEIVPAGGLVPGEEAGRAGEKDRAVSPASADEAAGSGAGESAVAPPIDELKYQSARLGDGAPAVPVFPDELFTLKLRYKQPDGDTSAKFEVPVAVPGTRGAPEPSADFRFAAAVAAFGMTLRATPVDLRGEVSHDLALALARDAAGDDPQRAEFQRLVEKAKELSK
ncbi:MAG: von Willebrand factor type A domain-containing protein [Planctomycetes bacterium]|nr:von Willebrand factor type A domain-containing protein [Planctomycetota bacterium]